MQNDEKRKKEGEEGKKAKQRRWFPRHNLIKKVDMEKGYSNLCHTRTSAMEAIEELGVEQKSVAKFTRACLPFSIFSLCQWLSKRKCNWQNFAAELLWQPVKQSSLSKRGTALVLGLPAWRVRDFLGPLAQILCSVIFFCL